MTVSPNRAAGSASTGCPEGAQEQMERALWVGANPTLGTTPLQRGRPVRPSEQSDRFIVAIKVVTRPERRSRT